MAQANQNIQNLTFPAVRAQINDNLAALFTTSSGPSAPSQTKPHQLWVDTSTDPPVLKVRDGVTEEFHPVGILDPGGFKPSGVTPIANGGTGQNTVAAAIAALLPSQTGNADKALLTNGTSLLWGAITSSSFTKYTFAAGTGTGSTRTHLWTKPSTGSIAVVLIWGGGGAGGRDGGVGGGGGAGSNCGFGLFPLADLGSTETITLDEVVKVDRDRIMMARVPTELIQRLAAMQQATAAEVVMMMTVSLHLVAHHLPEALWPAFPLPQPLTSFLAETGVRKRVITIPVAMQYLAALVAVMLE